jgi:hypothetical protein
MQAVRFSILLSLFLTANSFAGFTIHPQPKSNEQVILFGEQHQWAWENDSQETIILSVRLYGPDNKKVDQCDARIEPETKKGIFVFGILRQNKVLTRVLSIRPGGGQQKIESDSDEPELSWSVRVDSQRQQLEIGKPFVLAEGFTYEEIKVPAITNKVTTVHITEKISQPYPSSNRSTRIRKAFQRLQLTLKKIPTKKEIDQRIAEVTQLLKKIRVGKKSFNDQDSQYVGQYLIFDVPKITNNEGLISGVVGICGASPYRLGKIDISFNNESLYDALNLFAEKAGSKWELSIYNDLSDVSISFNAIPTK